MPVSVSRKMILYKGIVMEDYDIYGKTADRKNILLCSFNDRDIAEVVFNVLKDLSEEKMLVHPNESVIIRIECEGLEE